MYSCYGSCRHLSGKILNIDKRKLGHTKSKFKEFITAGGVFIVYATMHYRRIRSYRFCKIIPSGERYVAQYLLPCSYQDVPGLLLTQ